METVELRQYNDHNLATTYHDAPSKDVVIFCHGYRSSNIGPNRCFVRAARELSKAGIASLRFDQYGSGNSEGDFFNSSFSDWVATTTSIARDYLNKGFRVALFGQSMGGSTVLTVGAEVPELAAVVAWVPDAGVDTFTYPESGTIEEAGQIVQASYWQEAHDARIADQLARIRAPTYIIQCTNDEYVDAANREAIAAYALPHQKVDTFTGYSHSSWTYEQASDIITKSVDFLVHAFAASN